MNSMLDAMQRALDEQAVAQHMAPEAEEVDNDDGLSEHQVIYDDQLGINDDYVLDIVETPQSRKQRAILRRAGWLKDEGEPTLCPDSRSLQEERMSKFRKTVRVVKRGMM